MSAPTAPSSTTICTEALTRFLNGGTPAAADITRAINYGLEKVKRDIMTFGKTWRPLITTSYDITAAGVSHYANPSDFEGDLSIGLMTGDHTGALGVVTSSSKVTLAATEDATELEAEGKLLLITSGTGVDQAQLISAYNATTKVADLNTAYGTLPVTGDGYMIVNSITDLTKIGVGLYDQFQYPGKAGTPKRYAFVPNDTVGQLALQPVPNAVFGIRRKYYADLMKVDTAGTLYSTLLRRWAGLFEQGVYVWKLSEDDDRYTEQNNIYQAMILATMGTDLDGFDATKAAKAMQGQG